MAIHRLPRIGFGLNQVSQISEVQPKEKSGGHEFARTAATIVMALVSVFAAITRDPKIAWALVSLMLLTLALMYGSPVLAFFKARRIRAARDTAARAQNADLLRIAKRLYQFTHSGDSSNLRHIVSSAHNHDQDKCAQVCPTDYMKDLSQFLLQDFEARPPENERHFLLAAQKLYGFIASYNNNYVLEPLRRMRMKRWLPASAAPQPGLSLDLVPELVMWIEGLPINSRDHVGREIEDFRERWAGFLDDTKKWLEKMSESFGVMLPDYFERPQKL